MLTHRNLMTMGLTYFVDVDPVGADDAIVYAAPMSHGAGIYAIPHLMAGARHVVPASGGVDPAELFALGRALGPLSTFAAPTIVKRLVDHAQARAWRPTPRRAASRPSSTAARRCTWPTSSARCASWARASCRSTARAKRRWSAPRCRARTSPTPRIRATSSGSPRSASRRRRWRCAWPMPRAAALPLGEIGEVLVRGDTVMAGYWRNPEATAAALRDGWLFTGDVGSLDADGFLTLKDRSKDLIISGGSNIYPREVEEVLLTAPGVAEVAVVGAPDPEWGEVVVAFVVAAAGRSAVDPAALDAHCLERIARFKRPKRYLFVECAAEEQLRQGAEDRAACAPARVAVTAAS